MSRRSLLAALWLTVACCAHSRAEEALIVLPEPTALEAELLRTLDQTVSLTFDDIPLEEAFESIGRDYRLRWQIDRKGLEDAGVTPDTPITWRLRDVSLRSALDLILSEMELTWTFEHEVLLVTTAEKANNTLATRYYHVDPLSVRSVGRRREDRLAELVREMVEPESWDEVGGPGAIETITVNGRRWLVVSQTRDVHEQIVRVLNTLYVAGGVQSTIRHAPSRLAAADRPRTAPSTSANGTPLFRFSPSLSAPPQE